jgi:hypothetical protein
VFWNKNIFPFLFIVWFPKTSLTQKGHTMCRKTRRDCPQRNAEEPLVCYRLATSLDRLDSWNFLCFYRYINFFDLIMGSFTIDLWKKKIYRLLACCIFTISASTNCSKWPEVLLKVLYNPKAERQIFTRRVKYCFHTEEIENSCQCKCWSHMELAMLIVIINANLIM